MTSIEVAAARYARRAARVAVYSCCAARSYTRHRLLLTAPRACAAFYARQRRLRCASSMLMPLRAALLRWRRIARQDDVDARDARALARCDVMFTTYYYYDVVAMLLLPRFAMFAAP